MAEGGQIAGRVAEGIIAKAAKAVMKDIAEDALKAGAKDAAKDAAKDVAKDAAKDVAKTAGKDAAKDASKDAAKDAGRDAARTSARETAEAGEDTAKKVADRTATKDPIDVASGEAILHQVDVELPGVLPLVLERTHVSSYRTGRWFGTSWSSTLDQRLEVDDLGVCLVGTEGMVLVYPIPMFGEEVMPERGPRRPLSIGENGYRITDPQQGRTLHFAPQPNAGVKGVRASVLPLKAITDRNGNRIDLEYDGAGTLTEVRHSGGYRIGVETAAGRITALRLLNAEDQPVLKRFGYNDAGRLTEVINSSGRPTRFEYDPAGRMTRWEDTNGHWYTYAYDERGRGIAGRGSGDFLNATLTYHDDHTVVTDSLGHDTVYHLNGRRQVIAEVDPLGNTTRYEWDANGNLLSRVDPLGHSMGYTYDELGNLTSVARADGSQSSVVYDHLNLPVRVVDVDGSTWHQTYDERGNLVSVTNPMGSTTGYVYDERGGLTRTIDPLGAVTQIETDKAGLPVRVTDPLGSTVRLTRDAFERVTAVNDPIGEVTGFEYTVEGKILRRTLPDGTAERWKYDSEGNLTEHIDALGGVTRYEVTCFDVRSAQIAPDGARLEFAYDTELRLIAVTNPQGQVWKYQYDAAGNLLREIDFNGRAITYAYDVAGRLAVRTNASGQSIHYVRDAFGNVVEKWADEGVTRFAHDPVGRLVGAINQHADLRLKRNPLGRVVAEISNGRVLSSAYDAAGRRVWRRTPSGSETVWQHDAASRPIAMQTAGQVTQFAYDAAGREIQRRIGYAAVLDQRWDSAYRLRSQTLWGAPNRGQVKPNYQDPQVSAAQPRLLQHRAYGYRPDGNLVAIDDRTFGDRNFTLDAQGRVAAVQAAGWSERYAYDTAGNITSSVSPMPSDDIPTEHQPTDWEYSGALIRSGKNTRYEYDGEGRVALRQRKRLSGKPLTWRYAWDAEDRLIATITPDGQEWRYQYDPLGRRISKKRLAPDRRSVIEQIDFTWDEFLIAEQEHKLGAVGGGRARVVTWNYDLATCAPLTQVERSPVDTASQQWIDEQFYAIVTDLVGTPTEMVDSKGMLVWRPRATLWGRHFERDDGPVSCPLRFPGQYLDRETELHYNYRRYYDPEIARYISADPIGLAGGTNPYGYVSNPTAWTDPLGLSPYEGNKKFYRGSKGGQKPNFEPRPNEYKVDPKTGKVRGTHGVSVFDNPKSVSSKGFTPNEIDLNSVPDELTIIQRGADPKHYEIVPVPGTSLTPEEFSELLGKIKTK